MTVIERYELLKAKVIDRKESFIRLMNFVENETSFLSSPASIRFHLNIDGGLLEHSVNVAETLLKIKTILAPNLSDESCVIVGLLHDLGKAGTPTHPQYIKRIPSSKQIYAGYRANPPYDFNPDQVYLSVPIRSLYLILPYFSLSEQEAQAIVYHDGQYVEDNRSAATREEPLTLLLQYADNWSGFIIEKEKNDGIKISSE